MWSHSSVHARIACCHQITGQCLTSRFHSSVFVSALETATVRSVHLTFSPTSPGSSNCFFFLKNRTILLHLLSLTVCVYHFFTHICFNTARLWCVTGSRASFSAGREEACCQFLVFSLLHLHPDSICVDRSGNYKNNSSVTFTP